MKNYTKNGLTFIIIGTIIAMIGLFLLGLYQFFVPANNVAVLLGYVGFGAIGGVGGILTFVGSILFFIGRKEFGERHQQFVIYALLSIIIGVVFTTIFSIIGSFLFSALIYTTPIITIISAVTGGLGYVFGLYELENDAGKKILYIAFFVSIVIAVIIGFLNVGEIGRLIEDYSSENVLTSFSYLSNVSIYSTFAVISSFFWLIVLYIPYKRLSTGELVPKNINLFESSESISQRHCPNCGRVILDDANICPYCGKRFENYL
jgi:hypothetical protein